MYKNKKYISMLIHNNTMRKYTGAAKDEGMYVNAFCERLMALGWEVYCDKIAGLEGRMKNGET